MLGTTSQWLLFTDPSNHRIWKFEGRHVNPWAGCGAEGDLDSPSVACTFEQITGIAVAREKNVYVVDTQLGNVKLLVDSQPTAYFLQHLGLSYKTFGVYKKGTTTIVTSLELAIPSVSNVEQYVESTIVTIRNEIGRTVTNGPDSTISAKTKDRITLLSNDFTDM